MTSDMKLITNLICGCIGGVTLAIIALLFGCGFLGVALAYTLGGACTQIVLGAIMVCDPQHLLSCDNTDCL